MWGIKECRALREYRTMRERGGGERYENKVVCK